MPHTGRLELRICEARGLINDQTIGIADPYVIVKHERQQFKTKTIRNSLAPSWNETFQFHITDDCGLIRFEVWNKNLMSDSLMGICTVPMGNLKMGSVEDKWYPLVAGGGALGSNGKVASRGAMRLRLCAFDFNGGLITAGVGTSSSAAANQQSAPGSSASSAAGGTGYGYGAPPPSYQQSSPSSQQQQQNRPPVQPAYNSLPQYPPQQGHYGTAPPAYPSPAASPSAHGAAAAGGAAFASSHGAPPPQYNTPTAANHQPQQSIPNILTYDSGIKPDRLQQQQQQQYPSPQQHQPFASNHSYPPSMATPQFAYPTGPQYPTAGSGMQTYPTYPYPNNATGMMHAQPHMMMSGTVPSYPHAAAAPSSGVMPPPPQANPQYPPHQYQAHHQPQYAYPVHQQGPPHGVVGPSAAFPTYANGNIYAL